MTKVMGRDEAQSLTMDMLERRRERFNHKFRPLDRQDFESDDAYRAALLEQYVAIRTEEYNIICQDVGFNMAAASGYYTNKEGRRNIWDKCTWLEGATADQLRANSGVVDMMKEYGGGTAKGDDNEAHHCAITSTVIVAKISAKFGYGEDKNVVKKSDNHCWAASFQDHIQAPTYGSCRGPSDRVDLDTLIVKGEVGPGSALAVYSPKAKSKNHAKTLVSVERDEDGRPISYTIVENNGASPVSTYTIHYDKDGNVKPGENKVAVTSTNQWAAARIAEERDNLANGSIEAIEKAIGESRERVVGETGYLAELQVAEADMLSPQNGLSSRADIVRGKKSNETGRNRKGFQAWVAAYPDQLVEVNYVQIEKVGGDDIKPIDNTIKGDIELVDMELPKEGIGKQPEKKRSKVRVFFGKTGEAIKGIFKKKKTTVAETPEVAPAAAEVTLEAAAPAPEAVTPAPETPDVAPTAAEVTLEAAAPAPEAVTPAPEMPDVAPTAAGVTLEAEAVTPTPEMPEIAPTAAGVTLEAEAVTPAPETPDVAPTAAGVTLEAEAVTPTPEMPDVAPTAAGVTLEAEAVTPTPEAAAPAPDATPQETKTTMKSDAEVFFSFFMSLLLDDSKNKDNAAMTELLQLLTKDYQGNDDATERETRFNTKANDRLEPVAEKDPNEKSPTVEKAPTSFEGPIRPDFMPDKKTPSITDWVAWSKGNGR